VETLKLDNQVAVPLVRLEPPTAAAAVGPPPVSPPLPTDTALRRGRRLLSYGIARGRDGSQARLYSGHCTLPQVTASIKTTPSPRPRQRVYASGSWHMRDWKACTTARVQRKHN